MGINYKKIPEDDGRTRDLLEAYIEHGLPMPDLLMHIVQNDLFKTVTELEAGNLEFMQDVVLWLYTEAPSHAIGNREKVKIWMERGGLQGIKQRAKEVKQGPYQRRIFAYPEATD